MNIYVGNLPFNATETELKEAFQAIGEVSSCNIIKDKYSGQSRGFGFVEMPNKDEAAKAVSMMNGKDFKGRALKVNEAKARTEGPGGGSRY